MSKDDEISRQGCWNSYYKFTPHVQKGREKKHEYDEERNGRYKNSNGLCRDLKHILPKVKYITSGIKSISDTSEAKINELKVTSTVATKSTQKIRLQKLQSIDKLCNNIKQ